MLADAKPQANGKPMSTGAGDPAAQAAEPRANPRPWTNLLTRLFALVFVAILPALAIQAYDEFGLKRWREAEVRDDALRLATFAAGEIDRIVDNGRSLAVAITQLPAVQNKDATSCAAYLKTLTRSFPQYLAIGAADADGRVFCSNLPIPPGTNVADRRYFKEALRTGEFVIGDYLVGRVSKTAVLPLALRFFDPQGRAGGIVYLALDLDWLARYFEKDRHINADATLAIADRNGVILARLPNNAPYVGVPFAKVYSRYIFADRPGTADIVGIDGVRRILGYVPVSGSPAVGLYVGVGLTAATAFGAVEQAARLGFVLIAVGLAVGLALAWFGGRYFITAPIDKLLRASVFWRRGDFAVRADLGRGSSEIVQLGRTFDAMAAELHRRQQDNQALLARFENRIRERTRVLEAAEAELREANASLEAQARQLADANRELRSEMDGREAAEDSLRHLQKIEAMGQLTGGVAHDFNNLLQVILSSLDIVHRRLLRGELISAEHGWEQLEPAVRSAERAALLTAQLLAFARRQPLSPRPLDLNRLVAGMSELLRRTLGEGIVIETVLADGLWPVWADASQLENAIINLAVNARDAMPKGGKLTIETANVSLDQAYAAAHEEVLAGQCVLLAISDSGVGMSRDVVEKAFDPFFTTKEIGQGTGLGLSQVYGFIKQSGGHVTIRSEPGRGTTITMYLPRLMSAAERTPESPAQPPAARTEAILVVEDEPEVRDTTVAMLEELGYAVLAAADGPSGLHLLSQHPEIRLLFADIGLPGAFDGQQVADAARRIRSDLKILYTTGYARDRIIDHGKLDTRIDLLVKPFSYATLAAKIGALLDRP
jgi:signal transduction histidine kinase